MKPKKEVWGFQARFRRRAFGWKSQVPTQRVKEAMSEIQKTARRDPVRGAEGAVLLLERLSPALEHVDGSSGAMGRTVNQAIARLSPIIAMAPVDPGQRRAWLERLWVALEADERTWIEELAEVWGELCGSEAEASVWADRLAWPTRKAWTAEPRVYFHGATACLSALFRAGRYEDLLALLDLDTLRFWPNQAWGVRALAAQRRTREALARLEGCRAPWTSSDSGSMAVLGEEILLAAGFAEEAYVRYAFEANRGGTHLATFRALARKYSHKGSVNILQDLVASTPGEEGKWFAAAKEAGFLDLALSLANRTPCDPRTLTRAAKDHLEEAPAFALSVGLAALHWLSEGYGFDITSADVYAAYDATRRAGEALRRAEEVRERVRSLLASPGPGAAFMARFLKP